LWDTFYQKVSFFVTSLYWQKIDPKYMIPSKVCAKRKKRPFKREREGRERERERERKRERGEREEERERESVLA